MSLLYPVHRIAAPGARAGRHGRVDRNRIGVGLGVVGGLAAAPAGLPYRTMWWALARCALLNALACLGAALISMRPVLRLEPARVFAP